MHFSLSAGQRIQFQGHNYVIAYRAPQHLMLETADRKSSLPLSIHDAEFAFLDGQLTDSPDMSALTDEQVSLKIQFMPSAHRQELLFKYAFVRGFMSRPVSKKEEESYAREIASLNGFNNVPPVGSIRHWVTRYKKSIEANKPPLMALYDHRHTEPTLIQAEAVNNG
ncbi:hypothetical protein GCM10011369_18800 [Neiella marina]|uniref:Uncharacterized protein n=1 Tax=Neiella marina TaxID=508461 RepID=A0A8J2XPI7_9GAMM|nr:hypothetical protein [Neiella marina]GGA77184.1 hypothetical protein GCM10011369_18800 [Neiella marina]